MSDLKKRVLELERLREAATQGEWRAVESNSGHDIVAKRMQYSEAQFIDDAYMYHLPQRTQISWRLGDDGFLYASLSYETWRQFPSKEWDVAQEANAAFIAHAANHALPIVRDLAAEVERLSRGDWTADEINNICHNLHGTVSAVEFAEGCAIEQRKLYGCAPDADQIATLTAQLAAEKEAFSLCVADHDALRARLEAADARSERLKHDLHRTEESSANWYQRALLAQERLEAAEKALELAKAFISSIDWTQSPDSTEVEAGNLSMEIDAYFRKDAHE